jgi:cellulose synthase/poly-beta-1,6-N-acetylglucosamine synthase-like glycosyltransferase
MDLIWHTQWFFLLYFILLNSGYIVLNIFSLVSISRYMQRHDYENVPKAYSEFQPPISILVPAYNEEATIKTAIHSLLQLDYSEFEIVVINDGSKDNTLDVLIKEFNMEPFPEACRIRLKSAPIRTVYLSASNSNLRVIDKRNGGKADALNAGINSSRYPLFCSLDADSVLQRDSLQRVVAPFLEDPHTIAAGGTVRVANGCSVKDGFLVHTGLPSNLLALFQIMEYIRAFLFGRLGWSTINALLVISGTFGLFNKELVVRAGGYRTDTVGEDMELVVKLHSMMKLNNRPYRITFVPDPICWTEVPQDLKTLKNQRVRWQRGLSESLAMNIKLLFNPRAGVVGWIAFPFMVLFEWFGPVIEVTGYTFTIIAYAIGVISFESFSAFLTVAIGMGTLLSVTGLLLEELSFHIYEKPRHIIALFLAAVLENFGYRQLNSIWRLIGLYRWAARYKLEWGSMIRSGKWARHTQ